MTHLHALVRGRRASAAFALTASVGVGTLHCGGATAGGSATHEVARDAPGTRAPEVPDGAFWLDHVTRELLPFWDMPDALASPPGSPLGAFPSMRCDDGAAFSREKPCPEIARSPWLAANRSRSLVALSRQTYGYGVAFHLTGEPRYLRYAKAGVDFIRQHAIDRDGGGMFTTESLDDGAWGPGVAQRNPQELAYGLLGMAFYYYLTRDADVLADIVAVKRHIFGRYQDRATGLLRWLLADHDAERASEVHLVAQLDQLNAYLLLLAPILPEPDRREWTRDAVTLARAMIRALYVPDARLFFLRADRPADTDPAHTGADFGHTIKAMWLARMAGLLAGDDALVAFAESNGPPVLARAYSDEAGAWSSGVLAGGAKDDDRSWWISCELDQFAASMALRDARNARYLPRTYAFWRRDFVDHAHGEVWTTLDGVTHLPKGDAPKAWPWKSAYHTMEHALVGYVTGQATHRLPITLYYAFPAFPEPGTVRPYLYSGRIVREERVPSREGALWRVSFTDVR